MELVGDGVKVVGEDELVSNAGERRAAAARQRAPATAFAQAFTKVYSELADRSPVYAELRNLIDLSVMAAYIQQHDFYGKANWKLDVLGDESRIETETFNAPKQVATAVNAIWKGHQLLTPVGGGVEINAADGPGAGEGYGGQGRQGGPTPRQIEESIFPRAAGGGTDSTPLILSPLPRKRQARRGAGIGFHSPSTTFATH